MDTRLLRALLLALALALTGCVAPATQATPIAAPSAGAPAATPTATIVPASPLAPAATPAATRPAPPAVKPPALPPVFTTIPEPPRANVYEMAQRLRLKSNAPIPRVVNPQPVSYTVGQKMTFTAVDLDNREPFQVAATLRVVTPHAYFYIADDVNVPQDDLERSGQEFEERIYPRVTRYFGREWTPGVDNDEHLTILHARIPAVGGYYSDLDEYPKAVYPLSNQREMVYMNLDYLRPGTPNYYATLAHELQHAVHWRASPTQQVWVNEGLSELAAELAGYSSIPFRPFLDNPNTQLTTWQTEPRESIPHYAASHLFFSYLMEHYGGPDQVKRILAAPNTGVAGINDFLAAQSPGATFDSVFKDWVIANYLDRPGRYGYRERDVRVRSVTTLTRYGDQETDVRQYGARYYDLRLPAGDAQLTFQGDATVRILPTAPHSGRRMWWGNRGDSINTTLTHAFDLTGLSKATLTWWTWYNIEEGYDFAYVEVSADGGATWTILPSAGTRTDDKLYASFGPGYTGTSGAKQAEWVREQADLTPYAGRPVLVRFEYVTDGAVNQPGIAIDDISIPELGYADDAEDARGWTARGFVLTDNVLPQQFAVQLIEVPRDGSEPRVRQVQMDAEQRASVSLTGFGQQLEDVVLVISGLAPVTTEPARFRFSLKQP